MKIKLNKKHIDVVEHKTGTYENGIVCKYVLRNGVVDKFEFKRGNVSLLVWIPDDVVLEDLVCNNMHKVFKKIELSTEEDIINFEHNSEQLFYYYDGAIKHHDLTPVRYKYAMFDVYYDFFERNDKANIELLAEWLRNDEEIEIVELTIDEVPYYNANEDKDYDQYRINGYFRFKDKNGSLKYERKSSMDKNLVFSVYDFLYKKAQEFKLAYPYLKGE